ncbi:MAG: hypothetical protein KVP17_001290 [Porospora cf. gigantea B]|uniref:uncharacterized protein n=1 Tax=Porospora cf. gigantea B TaxID=2853592 RepID=UPI003571BDA0|nr:MAG: hypothetical protein KVP17_001290 [Porospora cf. gigantea B]
MSNLTSDQDGRCLFSETVPVTVEEDGSAKKSVLLVELRANGGEYLCSGFKLTISNDKDVFLLYSLSVDAMVYSDMKENQRLLVNFESFPKKLVEMLRSCIDGRLAAHASLHGMDAQLQILERNQFRELTHLVLKLHRADEPVLRKHLAAKMIQLKSACTVLQRQLEDANETRDTALNDAAVLEGCLKEAREKQ